MTGRSPSRDLTGHGRDEVATRTYVRSPRDGLRVLLFGSAALAALALTRWGERTILGFEQDLVDLVLIVPTSATRLAAGVLVFGVALALVVTWSAPIATRRFRLFGYLTVANLVTAALFGAASWWLDQDRSPGLANELAERAGIDARSVIGLRVLAQLISTSVVLAPFVSRRWRQVGAIGLPLLVAGRIVISIQLPTEVFVGVLIGATVGSAVLLAFGRPSRRPTDQAVVAALADTGLAVDRLLPTGADDGDRTVKVAELRDGGTLVVRVLGEDDRAADLLHRLSRFVRLRNVGDQRPFSNLRRSVEHEALVSLWARDAGVRTPRLRSVVDVGTDSMLLAHDQIDGRRLSSLADAELTDAVMAETWDQVRLLHAHRVAHRDLRRANVVLDRDGVPWLVGFRFSELAADEALLRADVAHLLASFAVAAGAERTARVAVEALGPEAVGAALPRLQRTALHSTTQHALRAQKGLLEELQAEVVRQCGVEEIQYEQLARVSGRSIFTVVMLAAVTYFLVPQFADLPGIVEQIQDANWWWLPPMLLASFATYVGATIAIAGAVPDRLPLGPNLLTQSASSFTGTLAPAGIGGMAVNVRFLQKQGIDQPAAVSSIGLNTAAGAVGHLAMLVVFAIWAGDDAFETFRFPDPTVFLAVGGAVLALGAIALAIPAGRRLAARRLLPLAARSLSGVTDVLQRPRKLAALMGGSVLVTSCYLVSVYFGVQAFGGGLGFATIGACYLLGSAVASAAPTPGGLGAMEAALIAALVAAGLDNAAAVPAVFLYRFTTFWVPILPGWLSFTYLRRSDFL